MEKFRRQARLWGQATLAWAWAHMQTLAILLALVFTVYELGNTRRAFQATTIAQVAENSRELQWRVLKDPALRELITGTSEPTPTQEQAVVMAMVINHFATLFDMRELGGIPDAQWSAFVADMRDTLRALSFRARWETLKGSHTDAFVEFVDDEILTYSTD